MYVRQAQLARPVAPAAPAAIAQPAKMQPRTILLRIAVHPRDSRPASIRVNGKPVDARKPALRVPLDQPLRIEVARAGSTEHRGALTLKSSILGRSSQYEYNVVLRPRRR